MKNKQYRVAIQPQGRHVYVLPGTILLEAVAGSGVVLDTPCGGAGTCGKCRVRVTAGTAAPAGADIKTFTPAELADGWRLACQLRVQSDLTVDVPDSSLFADQHQILATAAGGTIEVAPAIRKRYLELAAPSLEDPTPDLLRLEKSAGAFKTDMRVLRQLPARLRGCDFKGTAVLADNLLIDFEPGNTAAQVYGAAFDLGTTTLVGAMLDLNTGQQRAVVSRMNPQIRFGDDVLSRIRHASSCAECLEDVQKAVTHEMSTILETLCREAGVERRHVYEVAVAGNTAMQQIFCGIDSRALGEVPFVASHARGLLFPARDIGFPVAPCGMVYVFPVIGGFVGGDTTAGILVTRILEREGPVLMVDIGTNGEIVLAHAGRMWCASTAAGPAFEGARIACGMRAARGAIEKVVFNDDVQLGVIGQAPPSGICGSGLIDLVAELLNAGIITPEGLICAPAELPAGLPKNLARRVRVNGDGAAEFLLAARARGQAEEPVVLTQRDVREVQLGAGAIRAGVAILLKHAGIEAEALKTVLLAGGFGNFIRRNHAQRIGLLPQGVAHEKIVYVGNASLSGAQWALLSVAARKRAETLARQAEHVDLSRDPEFQMVFAESMIFPET